VNVRTTFPRADSRSGPARRASSSSPQATAESSQSSRSRDRTRPERASPCRPVGKFLSEAVVPTRREIEHVHEVRSWKSRGRVSKSPTYRRFGPASGDRHPQPGRCRTRSRGAPGRKARRRHGGHGAEARPCPEQGPHARRFSLPIICGTRAVAPARCVAGTL